MTTQTDILHDALPADTALLAPMAAASPPAWVPVRTLGARHRSQILQHLLALEPGDRVLRFGHAVADAQLARYVQSMNFRRDEVFGVFDRRLRLIALGHLALDRRRASGEFGVSVLARSRGLGLGRQLFAHAVAHARNRDVTVLMIHLARDNAPMLAIVKGAGATLSYDGPDALARVTVGPPTWRSQLGAMVDSQAAELDFRVKWQLRRLFRLLPHRLQPRPMPPTDAHDRGGRRTDAAAVRSPPS